MGKRTSKVGWGGDGTDEEWAYMWISGRYRCPVCRAEVVEVEGPSVEGFEFGEDIVHVCAKCGRTWVSTWDTVAPPEVA